MEEKVKVSVPKISTEEALKQVQEKFDISKVIKSAETERLRSLQKEMFLNLMISMSWAVCGIVGIWVSWLLSISGITAVALAASFAAGGFGLSAWFQSTVSKAFLGKFEHIADVRLKDTSVTIRYIPERLQTATLPNGWYATEVWTNKEFSALPYFIVIHKKPWSECFTYQRKWKLRFGVACPILRTKERLVEVRVLPSEFNPVEIDSKLPVPVFILTGCDGYDLDYARWTGAIPDLSLPEQAIKGIDQLESIRYKGILATREAQLLEQQRIAIDALEAGALIASRYLAQESLTGKILRATQSRWSKMSKKQKAAVLATAIVVSTLCLLLGFAMGGYLG